MCSKILYLIIIYRSATWFFKENIFLFFSVAFRGGCVCGSFARGRVCCGTNVGFRSCGGNRRRAANIIFVYENRKYRMKLSRVLARLPLGYGAVVELINNYIV